ncbi:hypothetical protein PGT21_010858 [Puccinia graminis f. sp. tritici]|uniref:Uncharacterized protein n=2 Tax=Puccinia graminis f. sp. tritici TaxID=56615 RepID=E3JUA4_PUCGT|nr:uncharacterized protein PGTG_00960 [Puccinia graminis f. sp. tritici CRL 75-36-700-3]EFP75629.2 hypothetical protein PGTG_00960 [Puccinia graminis f. sp. tritici CRL 75-36-700-3]KAA1107346.1 hypothetical protein PGT21_010858 [Puccinia graminis f. sp. tritici]KAA1124842.1 hypothetical protein PGTUg99_035863 [Puccinia graminis f. sp. tritici]
MLLLRMLIIACAVIVPICATPVREELEGDGWRAVRDLEEGGIRRRIPGPRKAVFEGSDPANPYHDEPELTDLTSFGNQASRSAGHNRNQLTQTDRPSNTELLWHYGKPVIGNLAALATLMNYWPELFGTRKDLSVFVSPGFFLSIGPSISCFLINRFRYNRVLKRWD